MMVSDCIFDLETRPGKPPAVAGGCGRQPEWYIPAAKKEERNPSLIASGNFLFRIDRFFDKFTIKFTKFLKKMIFQKFSKIAIFQFFSIFSRKIRFQEIMFKSLFWTSKSLKVKQMIANDGLRLHFWPRNTSRETSGGCRRLRTAIRVIHSSSKKRRKKPFANRIW